MDDNASAAVREERDILTEMKQDIQDFRTKHPKKLTPE